MAKEAIHIGDTVAWKPRGRGTRYGVVMDVVGGEYVRVHYDEGGNHQPSTIAVPVDQITDVACAFGKVAR